MQPTPAIDALHWMRRADEFRQLADTIIGAEAKATMLRMAEHYDHLAAVTEAGTASSRVFMHGTPSTFAQPHK